MFELAEQPVNFAQYGIWWCIAPEDLRFARQVQTFSGDSGALEWL